MQLEQEVVLLQSAEHAGKTAGQAVHPAEGRHADLTGLMAAERRTTNTDIQEHRTNTQSDCTTTRFTTNKVPELKVIEYNTK